MKKELEELRKKLAIIKEKDNPVKKVEKPVVEEEDEDEIEDEEDEEEEIVVKKKKKKKVIVEEDDDDEEDDDEEDEDEEEVVKPKIPTLTSELTSEEEEKIRGLQLEQERLQNNGAYRIEIIYQLHLLNESVAKLVKLLG